MRISDWSSDVCSSDLTGIAVRPGETIEFVSLPRIPATEKVWQTFNKERWKLKVRACYCSIFNDCWITERSEEHTSELQSLMRISYAVFCLKKKKLSTKILQNKKLELLITYTSYRKNIMKHTY